MNNNFDAINNSLDIEATEVSKEVIKKSSNLPDNGGEDTEKDYGYTRAQLYNLIDKGQEALNGILDIAQQSESPRAYEVAGQIIKNVADTTDKLLDLQQKMKKLDEDDNKGPKNVTTNNTMFIGSTADLQKILKKSINGQDSSK
jgi:hypothetical protein